METTETTVEEFYNKFISEKLTKEIEDLDFLIENLIKSKDKCVFDFNYGFIIKYESDTLDYYLTITEKSIKIEVNTTDFEEEEFEIYNTAIYEKYKYVLSELCSKHIKTTLGVFIKKISKEMKFTRKIKISKFLKKN
jgi:hypothetical protein